MIVFAGGMIGYTILRIRYFYALNQTADWGLIVGADVLFLMMLLFTMIKVLIPALKGNVALELNYDGVVDYIRNNMIDWSDILSLEISSGKTSSNVILNLKYGDTYTLFLSMVDENTDVIYEAIHQYLKYKKAGS